MAVLKIVEPIDQPVTFRPPIGSFLVSLLVHAVLLLVLWCLVYATVKRQSIFLTASASASPQAVKLELATKAKPVQPVAAADQFAPADSIVTSESLVSKFMDSDARAESLKFEPASIEFFGARAYGNRFVFVLDISYSMGARDGERFRRACDELLRSVSQLRRGQSYYVFLFCWGTEEMFRDPSIEYVNVVPGHEQKLHDWIYDVRLGAGTDPRRALALARQMKPDAVFLLSDGHFNKPNAPLSETGWIDDQGEVIQADVQAGVELFYGNHTIHTIAFENPFTLAAMQDIADATGGNCRYIKTGSHQPVDSKRFLSALRHIDQKRRNQSRPRQEYLTRLSYARELIGDGELAYAEYLVRPLRHADRSMVANPALLAQVLTILAAELGQTRLEDFQPPPELSEILGKR